MASGYIHDLSGTFPWVRVVAVRVRFKSKASPKKTRQRCKLGRLFYYGEIDIPRKQNNSFGIWDSESSSGPLSLSQSVQVLCRRTHFTGTVVCTTLTRSQENNNNNKQSTFNAAATTVTSSSAGNYGNSSRRRRYPGCPAIPRESIQRGENRGLSRQRER